MERREWWEDIKRRGSEKHCNKFGYLYLGAKTHKDKLGVICPRHGIFYQSITNHLRGDGCRKCFSEDNAGKYHQKTFGQFMAQSKEIHGYKYLYGDLSDIRGQKRIEVWCPFHGVFKPVVTNFLNKGTGCSVCSSVAGGLKNRLTQGEVLKRCEESLSQNGMTFENLVYNGTSQKMTVTCDIHGDFDVNMEFIYKGRQCPFCRAEDPSLPGGPDFYRTDKPSHIYLLIITDKQGVFLKVGIAHNMVNRLACYRRDFEEDCTAHFMASFVGSANYVRRLEQAILKEYPKLEIENKFSGYTECRDTKYTREIFFRLRDDPDLVMKETSETVQRIFVGGFQ